MASTNSKNSRMRYNGYNNNRIYQYSRNSKRAQKDAAAMGTKFINSVFGFFGYVFLCLFSEYKAQKRNEEYKNQQIANKLEQLKNEDELLKAKQKREEERIAKEQVLKERWEKNKTVVVRNQEYHIGYSDYKSMTAKERTAWDNGQSQANIFAQHLIIVEDYPKKKRKRKNKNLAW